MNGFPAWRFHFSYGDFFCLLLTIFLASYMDKCPQNQPKIQDDACCEEVSSIEWGSVDMNEQEEDIISRMHRLVGDKWALIAGRVPGRKPEEIERYWLMKNNIVPSRVAKLV